MNRCGERLSAPCSVKAFPPRPFTPPKSRLQFTIRAGHPNLFRASGGLFLPGIFHRCAHSGEPPFGPRCAYFAPAAKDAALCAIESKFELIGCRHNLPFFRRHPRKPTWTLAVQVEKIRKYFKGKLSENRGAEKSYRTSITSPGSSGTTAPLNKTFGSSTALSPCRVRIICFGSCSPM